MYKPMVESALIHLTTMAVALFYLKTNLHFQGLQRATAVHAYLIFISSEMIFIVFLQIFFQANFEK
jgi:hypothetical protein